MQNLLDYFEQHTDGSFDTAVRLVRAHAPGAITARLLGRLDSIAISGSEPGEYEWGKVRHALRNVEQVPDIAAPVQPTQENKQQEKTERTATGNVGTTPEAKRLHKEHAHYHALLHSATTDAERAEHAHHIMSDIIPRLDAIYDSLRAGDNPEPTATDFDPIAIPGGALGGADAMRLILSLRSRVSRLKTKLIPNAPTVERRAALEKELEQKLAEIARLESDIA
jgi:hypothetical protein